MKVLVAFLSNQEIGGQLNLLPHPFAQNRMIKTKRKPFSKKNQYAIFVVIIYLRRAKIKHALIQKRSEIK